LDGILNLNKPAGMTSFGVVARVKYLTREKHTGHAGTLDPLATGVLPVCLGQATRIMDYLFAETKTYRTVILTGLTTDTYDISGKVIARQDFSSVNLALLESILPRFRGAILQVPPMHSALKLHGQPLYKLARNGQEVERQARPVNISRLALLSWQPPLLTLEVECSKGTYIRSLAHDLGQALGCGAAMQSLERTRVGQFLLTDAITLDQLATAVETGCLEKYLHPADYPLVSYPALIASNQQQCALVHGQLLSSESTGWPPSDSPVRVYNQNGDFVGMVAFLPEKGCWQPLKIFLKTCCQN
jgi:tRNA pseudouridine55 synthase